MIRCYNSFQPGIYLLSRRFCEFGNYQLPNWNREVFGMQNMKSSDKFFGQVVQLFRDAKRKMSMAVNMDMVYSYYEAGRMIIDEEQNGDGRAVYGKYILQELSRQLTEEFGRGFSYENLKLMRRFYVVYSKKDKKDAVVETTLPKDNNQIFASKYQTVLPSKEELQRLMNEKE